MIRSVYLAGPDVFLPDAEELGRKKVELCLQYGLDGLFPLDNAVEPAATPASQGLAIYDANVALMERADAIMANLTPFRGPSADAGTVFELGYFAARGKPIYAYSSDVRPFAARTREHLGLPSGASADEAGSTIEDFDMADNLMLAGAVKAAGGAWVCRPAPPGGEIAALDAFRACLATLAASAAVARPSVAAG
ncbi:MAG TPA: nucleoside 2-deoxyribosyltransferase [Allosphingosinicella sp.]|jgi:nucleoside 2-deoxyribosyltransferase|nr:nucleoside 2-deoxyribosyltransferase [Allosphingosinicella sp.]